MKWIDVNKRLPGEPYKVIATDGKDYCIKIFSLDEWEHVNCETCSVVNVTFWMPILAPLESESPMAPIYPPDLPDSYKELLKERYDNLMKMSGVSDELKLSPMEQVMDYVAKRKKNDAS